MHVESYALPNQEILGAQSELQGGTVGVCSYYKRGGINCALRSMQMCLLEHIYEVKHLRVKNIYRKCI